MSLANYEFKSKDASGYPQCANDFSHMESFVSLNSTEELHLLVHHFEVWLST